MDSSIHTAVGQPQWYVLRDFRPANTRQTAYEALQQAGVKCFTPMHWVIVTAANGQRRRKCRPVLADLLFAYGTREELDPVIEAIGRLQYRYLRGSGPEALMTVPEAEMNRFIAAVATDDKAIYYTPQEISPAMYGKKIRITGGPLHGVEGRLLKARGSRKRRLLVEIPDFMVAAVEVEPEFVEII